MTKESKDLKERDFHHGEGHTVPLTVKIAWIWMMAIGLFYCLSYVFPSIKELWK